MVLVPVNNNGFKVYFSKEEVRQVNSENLTNTIILPVSFKHNVNLREIIMNAVVESDFIEIGLGKENIEELCKNNLKDIVLSFENVTLKTISEIVFNRKYINNGISDDCMQKIYCSDEVTHGMKLNEDTCRLFYEFAIISIHYNFDTCTINRHAKKCIEDMKSEINNILLKDAATELKLRLFNTEQPNLNGNVFFKDCICPKYFRADPVGNCSTVKTKAAIFNPPECPIDKTKSNKESIKLEFDTVPGQCDNYPKLAFNKTLGLKSNIEVYLTDVIAHTLCQLGLPLKSIEELTVSDCIETLREFSYRNLVNKDSEKENCDMKDVNEIHNAMLPLPQKIKDSAIKKHVVNRVMNIIKNEEIKKFQDYYIPYSDTDMSNYNDWEKGVNLDNPVENMKEEYETTTLGAKQSVIGESFEYLPVDAMKRMAQVRYQGVKKYGEDNHLKISSKNNVGRAISHLFNHLNGDTSEDHLAHALVRICMAIDVINRVENGGEGNE